MVTFALGLLLITLLSSITGSQQATCDENEFSCTDGTCIDSFLVCDGDQNCPDGSDETKSACPKINIPCPPRAFRCAYGACIDGSKKCNGQKDCADNSDEKPSLCGTPVLTVNASESSCPAGSWVCNNKQCINQYLVCDGDENCRDGSDETEASCINFPCPSLIGFQCAYGGCIDKDRKCDGKKDCKDNSDEDPKICSQTPTGPDYPGTNPIVSGVGCVLPDYPDGGEYKVVTGCEGLDRLSPKCRGVPGTLVDSNTAIVYSCFKRFSLDSNINKSICLNGNWFPGTPSCLRLCKALESKSLVITCTYNGSPVDCTSQGVLPETKASLKCKQFYQPSGFNYDFPFCNHDGSWSESLFSCRPECGITTNNNVTVLVSYGENASSVEYPWHAGLYKFDKDINDIEFFCGGTVIAPYMILTAAHCVYDLRYQPAELHVVVGKTTRSWKVIDTGEQRFTVTKILTHSDYRGNENHYAFDIAVLELNENIVVGRLAMPACIETIPPWTPIEVGTKGTVVGWGKNEFGKLSSQLMVVHLPYLDQATCKRRAGSFRDFITHDKFCATYDSRGAGVQQGDSGGGLVFYNKELNRYFIRGIVSTKPTDRNTFATFTNISEKSHASFLKETRSELRLRHE